MIHQLQVEALRTCEMQARRTLKEITAAITALEMLPAIMRSDAENDARWAALHALHAAFFYTYCSEFAAQRALS